MRHGMTCPLSNEATAVRANSSVPTTNTRTPPCPLRRFASNITRNATRVAFASANSAPALRAMNSPEGSAFRLNSATAMTPAYVNTHAPNSLFAFPFAANRFATRSRPKWLTASAHMTAVTSTSCQYERPLTSADCPSTCSRLPAAANATNGSSKVVTRRARPTELSWRRITLDGCGDLAEETVRARALLERPRQQMLVASKHNPHIPRGFVTQDVRHPKPVPTLDQVLQFLP